MDLKIGDKIINEAGRIFEIATDKFMDNEFKKGNFDTDYTYLDSAKKSVGFGLAKKYE